MKNTHSSVHLHCRHFGSAVLDTQHLLTWLDDSRRRLPIKLSLEFVQAEWLLSAIQRQVQDSLSREEALEVVQADPLLRDHEMADISPQWLLGGEAYRRWSLLLAEAVDAGELVLLEYSSKLPLSASTDDQSNGDPIEYGTGHEWKSEAKTMAIKYCIESIDAHVAEFGTDHCPLTQDVAARKLVDDLASMGRKLKGGKKAISYESAITVIKPWTAPEDAREIIRERETRKRSGNFQ